jgi:hypothetical protein
MTTQQLFAAQSKGLASVITISTTVSQVHEIIPLLHGDSLSHISRKF